MKRYDFTLTYKTYKRSYIDPTKIDVTSHHKKVRGYGNNRREAINYACKNYGCKPSQLSNYKGA